jgi:hypothetical protein
VGYWSRSYAGIFAFLFFMRPLSPTLRVLMKAGSVLLLWLLSVSVSYAAHAPRRATRRVCDPQKTTIHQLPRRPVTYGGPLAKPSPRVLAGLTDPMVRLVHGSRCATSDDDEAIQNDTPAAHLVVDPILELKPLGVFVETFEQRPRTRAFSPRSPRGPPIWA